MTNDLYAVTVLGHDRPGIIAETTAGLAGLGLNIEDSTMTLLRGHFAMMLLCRGAVGAAAIEAALAPLAGDELDVAVRPVRADAGAASSGSGWVLTVHGGDRPGIVSEVIREVAAVGGNITDLTTRLSGELYLLVAEIALPAGVDDAELASGIAAAAQRVGVTASLRPADTDEL
ncbi:glycine cleavage system protein R [Nocardioides sp.]|uniref:glycine cleavage system protein R n=1 Tax=Nocardioides sp. TaxID=35761 RepID=UPI00351682FB